MDATTRRPPSAEDIEAIESRLVDLVDVFAKHESRLQKLEVAERSVESNRRGEMLEIATRIALVLADSSIISAPDDPRVIKMLVRTAVGAAEALLDAVDEAVDERATSHGR